MQLFHDRPWPCSWRPSRSRVPRARRRRPALTEKCSEETELKLHGAGASFPFPLYRRWFIEYGQATPERAGELSIDRLRAAAFNN